MSYFGVEEAKASTLFDLPSFQVGDENPLLDPVTPFFRENYGLLMHVIPSTTVLSVNSPPALLAYQQVEDRMQVQPGSWLLAFSGASSQAAGFRFSVYDEGRKRYALAQQWHEMRTTAQDPSDTDPAQPSMLPDPYGIIAPGWLQLRLVNSASVTNDCQLVLWFAVPIGGLL